MPFTVSRPSGRRTDDVRALRFRFRTLTFSGTYTAVTGEVITLNTGANRTPNIGLSRIIACIPLDSVIAPAGTATGSTPKIDVAADGKSVTIKLMRDAAGAAQSTNGVELSTGAHTASSKIDLLFIGE